MSRGTTLKTSNAAYTELLRPMITRRYSLIIDHELCCGCDTCEIVCPRKAISLSAAVVENGHVVVKARVELDETKCSFCGECAAICPTRAFRLTVNGEPENPVLKASVWPLFRKRVSIDQGILSEHLDVDYIELCPSGAISADVECDASGTVTAVSDVQIDRQSCFNCTRCMFKGPEGGFTIEKPYEGRIFLKATLCPEGCQACSEVCPSHALYLRDGVVALEAQFCIYCKACTRVCPAEGALEVRRTGYRHMPIESGAWRVALEKLVDIQAVKRELGQKTQQKRRQAVAQRLLGEMKEE